MAHTAAHVFELGLQNSGSGTQTPRALTTVKFCSVTDKLGMATSGASEVEKTMRHKDIC